GRSPLIAYLGGILEMTLGNGDHLYRYRSQPQREGTGELLDQDTDEPLDAAEGNTVQHDGTMLFAVSTHVGDVEALGHLEVYLDGTALPGTADAVMQVEVDLRAIEGTVALIDLVGRSRLSRA